MFYRPGMVDALADYESAGYVLFGVPFDRTSSFRAGSRWAPDAMRSASANFESYNSFFDIDLAELPIHDAGNFEAGVLVDDVLSELSLDVAGITEDGKIPIMMGGEHSLTLPCVKACAKRAEGKFGVVVLDAHFDLRDEFEGVKYNHACVSRHILEEVTDNYVTIGVRSGPKEEWDFAKDNDICYYTPEEVTSKGADTLVEEIKEYLDCDSIYLSLDMDALDPAYAPALGTPEPFGLSSLEVRDIIRGLAPMSAGFDVMEITPEYDGGQTAILGAKFIREFIAAHAASMK
ncbi:agmatinase [Methanococcoides methylutens]|uniref:Agmatinase n=1 Tax=Methanococcoides methylutens MM1 TaxID=1434104 RepID=A0A0E3SQ97_METMT|nr:agmatinase [Methanococcoides methylutens]AKB84178.1 Agmatinase [Methanococcoides methylutens MM1]